MSQRKAPAPAGAYVQTMFAGGLCFISGQVPVDAYGQDLAHDDLGAQARQVFVNLEACLHDESLQIRDLVSITTYLTDVADAAEVSAVRSQIFGEHRPTSTVVGVNALLKPAWRLEVQAIALAGQSR